MIFPSLKQFRSAGASFFSKMDEEIFREGFGAGPTLSGTRVSKKNALEVSTFLACAFLKSKLHGQLKPTVYVERKSGGKDKVANDELGLGTLQYTLHKEPNPEMSGFTRRETRHLHGCLYANEYDLIIKNNLDEIIELQPLYPWAVSKIRISKNTEINAWDYGPFAVGDLAYEMTFSDGRPSQKISYDKVLHVPTLALNGLVGMSRVDLQREMLGIAKAIQEYEARYYGQGFMPQIIAEKEDFLETERDKAYVERLKQSYAGLGKSHGFMLIEGGIKVKEFQGRLDYAQIDSRSYANSIAICGIEGVPPPLVGLTKEATFSNITEQNLFFGQYGLAPSLARDEEAMFQRLLTPAQKRGGAVIKYNLDAILRADILKRWKTYVDGIYAGVYNADDVLNLEDMNPQPDGLGQIYMVPRNFRDKSKPDDTTPAQAQRAQEEFEKRQAEEAAARIAEEKPTQ